MQAPRLFRRGLLAWMLAGVLIVNSSPTQAETENLIRPGMTVRAALEILRDQGFNVVYSDALVGPDARVLIPPSQDLTQEEQAASLLAPLNLQLRRLSNDLLYVVRNNSADTTEKAATPPPKSAVPAQPTLEEIVVVATRHRLESRSRESRTLELQELETIPSLGRDALRATSQLPGMASQGISARNYVRGGNIDEVLYRIEGAPLIEPFHMSEFMSLLSVVNPDAVGAIDLYSAGFPASLGSRLVGVMDIELKEPDRAIQGTLNASLIDAGFYASGRSDSMEWLASGRRSTLDQFIRYLDEDYGKPRFHDELLQVTWFRDRTRATAGLLTSSDEMSLRDPGAGEDAESDFHAITAWTRVEFSASETIELALLSSLTAVENARAGELDKAVDAVGHLRDSREFQVITAQPSLRVQLTEETQLTAGLEAQLQSGEFDTQLLTFYGPLGEALQPEPSAVLQSSINREGRLFAAHASLRQAINDRLVIEFGLRHDVQDNDPVHDHQTSPRLQARFEVDPTLELYLNLGRYAQYQNLYELQSDDGLFELQEPQIAEQLNMGANWLRADAFSLRLDAYFRTVANPWRHFENLYDRWVLLPELHADRVALTPSKARAFGLELSGRWQASALVSFSGSYAIAKTEERLGNAWRDRPWDQTQSIRTGISWESGKWRVDAMASWHSGWSTNALFNAPAVPESLYGERLPDFLSIDLHLGRTFRVPRGELELYGDVANSTLHQNVGGTRFRLQEGTLKATDTDFLEPIPVLGVRWSW